MTGNVAIFWLLFVTACAFVPTVLMMSFELIRTFWRN